MSLPETSLNLVLPNQPPSSLVGIPERSAFGTSGFLAKGLALITGLELAAAFCFNSSILALALAWVLGLNLSIIACISTLPFSTWAFNSLISNIGFFLDLLALTLTLDPKWLLLTLGWDFLGYIISWLLGPDNWSITIYSGIGFINSLTKDGTSGFFLYGGLSGLRPNIEPVLKNLTVPWFLNCGDLS